MFKPLKSVSLAALTVAASTLAFAQAPVKIGFITTLSTPAGYLGQDARDAFMLAVGEEGGKLGGVPVEVIVEDDNLKPANGRTIAEKFLQRDGIKLFTGIIFTNVMLATGPAVLEAGATYVGLNSGPSQYAGKDCHKNLFVTSWQNDALAEASGQLATNAGVKKMVLLAPNYPAGKDTIAGFKRFFKGQVLDEIYTALDQTDFSAEMAKIRSLAPDAIYQFHPGGQGIAFLKQFDQSGLKTNVQMIVAAPSLEQKIAEATGTAAVGVMASNHWNTDFDNPTNKAFVKGFTEKYNRLPTPYAAQAYDAAKLIGAALKGSGGTFETEKFRTEMLKANAPLTRGAFKFGPNQFPIQDWYQVKAEATGDGKVALKTVGKIFTNHTDSYASACKM
jgi:branched-chain amino acid transport system substrate-binding protein